MGDTWDSSPPNDAEIEIDKTNEISKTIQEFKEKHKELTDTLFKEDPDKMIPVVMESSIPFLYQYLIPKLIIYPRILKDKFLKGNETFTDPGLKHITFEKWYEPEKYDTWYTDYIEPPKEV